MKTSKYILSALVLGMGLVSCDDMFEPAVENIADIDVMYNDPQFASGLLGNSYNLLPYSNRPNVDMATDDAVSNKNENSYRSMAAGSWTSKNDPVSQWQARNAAIQYINLLLENVEKVTWAGDPTINPLFIDLYTGDCLGSRALQRFYLLRSHAGLVGGQMLGVPFFDEALTGSSNFNMSRPDIKKNIEDILADIEAASALLPYNYKTISSASEIPAKYQALGTSMGGYNRAFGNHQRGKIQGQILAALKAQVLIWAASPAYSQYTGVTWAQAAEAAAAVVGDKEVVANGLTWYDNEIEINNFERGQNIDEAIWMHSNISDESNGMESDYFPPSIFGNGEVNPTQNLVDAFPMANGYPISDKSRSGYNENDPYAGRDPRLATFIVYNGSKMGVNDAYIYTGRNGANEDAIGKEKDKSTRTGYYLRKLMRNNVNLDPATKTTQKHINARIRWTEIMLDLAEALNEMGNGDTKVAGSKHSAKTILKGIRERAGICVDAPDPYLDECASDQAKMRALIHNERRLELCFENHRFYDLRRWKEELNVQLQGMDVDMTGGTSVYTKFNIEKTNYSDFMYYGPVPYSEIMKFGNLQQNQGW